MATTRSGARAAPPHAPDGAVPPLCPTCAAPLADDQRWCLNCGRRLGDGRADLRGALAPRLRAVERETIPAAAPVAGPLLRSPLGAGALAAMLAAGVAFGALLAGGDERRPQPLTVNVPRQEAPRVNVTVPAGGAAAAVPVDITSDWPGDDGWTAQLSTLPKEGTTQQQVDRAKSDAASKGARNVGIVDPDDYPSLDGAAYVLYSGVYKTKASAQRAVRRLRRDFPDAKAVRVAANAGPAPKVDKDADKPSKSELKDLENAAGDDFVKKSKKLKDKVGTAGKPPPTDNAEPGGDAADDAEAVIE